MSKFKDTEQKGFEINMEDIKKLRAGLAVQPNFDLLMMDWGFAHVGEDGTITVTDPDHFNLWNRVMGKIEAYDWFKNDSIRKSNPGEMNAHRAKIKRLSEEMRRFTLSRTIVVDK